VRHDRVMLKSDFAYSLPPDLIAQKPLTFRSASRLLALDGPTGTIRDLRFTDLPGLLRAGDLMVFNDTRVIPARLLGTKDTGGQVEVLIERVLDARRALVLMRASKAPRAGQRLQLEGTVTARVLARRGEFYELEFESDRPVLALLDAIGHMPLPPYIARADVAADRERYQTIYAREAGAVAAPTAGLHFDAAMLARLDALGVEQAFITLHVGAGTFQPLRVEEVSAHRMHREWVGVSSVTAERVNAARREGRRVVAVGTTVVRALEAAASEGEVQPFNGETDIFIYPGYRFRVVDALVTNFHLPESTLLMLVCALAGREQVLRAYQHAVTKRYRFFSYGDAMFVTRAA
jgi:S-adenosylmethionine:tRNA ribosyltransferase-isomerase